MKYISCSSQLRGFQMALLAWTMVHGIAKLAITARLPFPSSAEIFKFDQSSPVGR